MFNEDLDVFFNDFSEEVIYSGNDYSIQLNAIIDHNVELIGYEGQVSETVTTFTTKYNENVIIGGVFYFKSDTYEIDSILSNDESVMTVSVVKR
jgi:hypothetical protein